jgi:hypothetical protein
MSAVGDMQKPDGCAAKPRTLYVGAAKSAPQVTQNRDEEV